MPPSSAEPTASAPPAPERNPGAERRPARPHRARLHPSEPHPSGPRSAEARLILAAARAALGGETRAAGDLDDALRRPLDWEAVLAYAAFNDVLPLVTKCLTACGSLPPAIQARLLEKARDVAFHNLRQGAELAAVVGALEGAGIPVIPFKGPVLAATAYGDLSARRALDLDLLLRRADVERAVDLLVARGYVPRHATQTPEQRRADIDSQIGFDLYHPVKHLAVELHWNFFFVVHALPFDMEAIWARHRWVSFMERQVRALAPEDLLVYLCIHGTKHLWLKLKWLCDVAAVLATERALDWAAVLRRAEDLGVQRVVRLALLLVQEHLRTDLPAAVAAWSRQDRGARRLAQEVSTAWVLAPPGTARATAARVFWFHFRERERWRDRLPLALHRLRLAVAPSEKDRAFVRLPRALSGIYILIRPVRIAVERWQQG